MAILKEKARIIVDPRDASKDYWLDSEEAKKLYGEGKLALDLTNSPSRIKVYTDIQKSSDGHSNLPASS